MNLNSWLVVIPARLHSQRLPRKPLIEISGKALILRVFDNLRPLAEQGAHLVVATDSEEIASLCRASQIPVELTRHDHPSGTDRCNEVAERFSHPFVLNVQGDEPFINCADLLTLMKKLENTEAADMATLVVPSENATLIAGPNTVKVVCTKDQYALYFSRLPIPFWRENIAENHRGKHLLHLGVYAFRKESLQAFCGFGVSYLEAAEKLEQLRALEQGMKLAVVEASHFSCGIDTPEDVLRAEALLAGG